MVTTMRREVKMVPYDSGKWIQVAKLKNYSGSFSLDAFDDRSKDVLTAAASVIKHAPMSP
jgi:hypothetical protein